MFSIFHGDTLIGHSELENGDPPMGVAFGRFEPTDGYSSVRSQMKPARDGAGKELPDSRFVAGLCAKTADGTALVCADVSVWECGEMGAQFEMEATCLGIEYPRYEDLFPHHVRAYEDYFKK